MCLPWLTSCPSSPWQTKTLHCFMLNGVIFLGSVLLLHYALLPAVTALLGAALPPAVAGRAAAALAGLYSALWLLPAYLLSFLINCLWYSELAEMAVAVAQRAVLQVRRGGAAAGGLPASPQAADSAGGAATASAALISMLPCCRSVPTGRELWARCHPRRSRCGLLLKPCSRATGSPTKQPQWKALLLWPMPPATPAGGAPRPTNSAGAGGLPCLALRGSVHTSGRSALAA